jgi:hypothetical protein
MMESMSTNKGRLIGYTIGAVIVAAMAIFSLIKR